MFAFIFAKSPFN